MSSHNFALAFDFRLQFFLSPFSFSLPWNQKTPIGYTIEIIHTLITTQCYYSFNGLFLLLFITICLHHQAFYKISQHAIEIWEQPDNKINDKMFLRDLIQFHVITKTWFSQTTKIYSYIVLVQLICSMLMMACLTFQLDLVIENSWL